MAIVKVETLNSLMELNGVEFIDAYRNKNSCKEIMEYIAAYFREKLINDQQSSFCFGISFDCSQDRTSFEQLIITVKYITNDFKVEEKYLKLITLEAKDSQSIFNKIQSFLKKENLLTKLVAISTDGEPKIASKKKGVVGKFIDVLPFLIHTHCICHQLILGIKDLFKKKNNVFINSCAQDLQTLNSLIYKLASYFTSSSKRNIILLDAQEELFEENKTFKLCNPLM